MIPPSEPLSISVSLDLYVADPAVVGEEGFLAKAPAASARDSGPSGPRFSGSGDCSPHNSVTNARSPWWTPKGWLESLILLCLHPKLLHGSICPLEASVLRSSPSSWTVPLTARAGAEKQQDSGLVPELAFITEPGP